MVARELATNALIHARTSFTVKLRTALGQAVILEVRDGSSAQPAIAAIAPLGTNGRGITIVDALSQAWGVDTYESGGKSVWAVFPTT